MLRASHRMQRSAAVVLLSTPSSLSALCWLTPPQILQQEQRQQQQLSFKPGLSAAPLRRLCDTGSRLPHSSSHQGSSSEGSLYSLGQYQHPVDTSQLEWPSTRSRGCLQQHQQHQYQHEQQQQQQDRRDCFTQRSSFVPTATAAAEGSSPTSSAVLKNMAGNHTPTGVGGGHEAGDGDVLKEGTLVLNREEFSTEISVVAVKVPAKRTSEVQVRLRKELMNARHRKNVERCPGDDKSRLLLLSTAVKDPDTLEGLSAEAAAFVKGDEEFSITTFNVKTDYSMLGVEEVLTRLLQARLPGKDLPTSFEVAGHLAHLNLKDYLLPYKSVIGQVIIDKNPRISTVVNKVNTISTQFRTFPMEVVAGEHNTEVVVKESGCSFRFDFAKVYWNSRLQTEHARLIKVIGGSSGSSSKVVCDMMAGVGPFAIPLAKGGHRVYANDLNPDSFAALRANGFKNKVGGRLTTSNECGRAFARRLIEEGKVFHHAILNLPDSALTFLDVFRGVDWAARGFKAPPTVHVYCFSRAADPQQDALDRANEVMGSHLTAREVKFHVVRDVAPNKPMLCLSFSAPDAAAVADATSAAPAAVAAPAATGGGISSGAINTGPTSGGATSDGPISAGGGRGPSSTDDVPVAGREVSGEKERRSSSDSKRQRTEGDNGRL